MPYYDFEKDSDTVSQSSFSTSDLSKTSKNKLAPRLKGKVAKPKDASCKAKRRVATIKQALVIGIWKQQNLKVTDVVVRHFWTKVLGFEISLLEALWSEVDDPMDVDD